MQISNSLLSVVVTSYTTERLNEIFALLDSIKMQTYPNIELIFVIERSEKLLEEIKLHSGSIKLFNAKYIFSKDKLGLAKARNIGILAATGDILAFTDDDAIPFANWAEEIVNAFSKHKEIIGVTGPFSRYGKAPRLIGFLKNSIG